MIHHLPCSRSKIEKITRPKNVQNWKNVMPIMKLEILLLVGSKVPGEYEG